MVFRCLCLSCAHYAGFGQAYYALPKRLTAPIAAIANRIARWIRDFEKVLAVITHHEEDVGVPKGFSELLAEIRLVFRQIGVPTTDGVAFIDAMSHHKCMHDLTGSSSLRPTRAGRH